MNERQSGGEPGTLPNLAYQYRMRFEASARYRERIWEELAHRFFQRYVKNDAVILELGVGWGEFIRNIRAATRFAMDLNPDAAARIGHGVTFLHQDCSEHWGMPDSCLDVVFTSNFFEHLRTKEALQRVLAEARRCLKPGGRLVCLGPNIRFIPGAYWDFWDHYLPLTERSLSEGLALTGFEVERCVSRFLPYSMSQGFQPPAFLVAIYLRMPLLWRLFGKQFLVIGRKPMGDVTRPRLS